MKKPLSEAALEAPGPLDLSDEDVLTAMKEIGGYIDITAGDFQALYRIAHRRALKRLMGAVRAGNLMTREVVFVEKITPLESVAETMARHNISGVPVVGEDGGVAGMVSERDFLKQMLPDGPGSFIGLIAECLRAKGCLAVPIRKQCAGDIMTSPAVTVGANSPLAEIIRLFREQRINRTPVLNERGHILSALIGVAGYQSFPAQVWLAAPLAVDTAIAAMHLPKTLHPPGGATALIAVIGGDKIHALGFFYALMPVGLGAAVMLVVALIVNNIPRGRRYPEFWL